MLSNNMAEELLHMKTNRIAIVASVLSMLLSAVGCSKQEEGAAPAAETTTSISETLKENAAKVGETVQAQTEAVKKAAEETAATVRTEVTAQQTAVQQAVSEQAATVESKVKEVMAKAQQLYSEGKFQDALTSLNSLAATQLSPENQATVQKLKEQIQSALQSAATATDKANKAVGNLLQPNP